MIITLKGADFSSNNIGTLSTWTIFTSLGVGATYDGVKTVDKGASFTGTVTIADGYEIGTAGVSVMMGTTDITSTAVTTDGNEITISISAVTGNVTISVPTINTSTGEEETKNYTITYKYVDSSGNEIATATTETVTAGTVKTFSTTNAQTIDGFTVNSVTPQSTTVNSNITVTYTYTANASGGSGTVTELTFETLGFYNNSTQGGGITSPNASWLMSDLIPINTLTNGSNGYCTSMLQGHSKVAVVYYASSNNTDASAFLGNYGTTTQGEQAQYTAEQVKENAPEGTTYVGFSTHSGLKPLHVYVLQ